MALPTRVAIVADSLWNTTPGSTYPAPALAVTAGQTLVVGVGGYQAGGGQLVTGITDSAGQSYTKADHVDGPDGHRNELWSARMSTGHAANIVTVTWSAAVQYRGIVVVKYAGLAASALDGSAKGTAAAGVAAVTTGTLTTTRADAVHVLLPTWGLALSGDSITWPSGFTAFSPSSFALVGERFVAAPVVGPYTVTHSTTAAAKRALVAAFSATAAAPAAVTTAQSYVWMPV